MEKLKTITKSLFTIGLGILFTCFLFELILQITDHTKYNRFTNDSVSGLLTYKPNSTYKNSRSCLDNLVVINNLGFHGPNFDTTKEKDVYRIVVVGGSFIESLQVQNDKMFSSILQNKLNSIPNKKFKYEVIPIAFSGNRIFLDILYYLRYARDLKPDLVINQISEYEAFGEPDIRYDANEQIILGLPKESQSHLTVVAKNVMRNSKLMMNVYNKLIAIKLDKKPYWGLLDFHKDDIKNTEESYTSIPSSQWEKESKLFEVFSQKVKEDGAKFLVVSWFNSYVALDTKDSQPKNLKNFSKSYGFYYFNMEPGVNAEARFEGKSPVWPCDDHWSEDGHRYVADDLYRYLKQNPKLIGN